MRVSPASPSKWMATRSPLPASTWRSTQLWATLSSTADEPLRERRVVPVERALEVLRPRDAGAGLLGPEPLVVLGRGVVHRGGPVGLRGERRVGREVHLVHVAGQAVVGHGVLLLVECQGPANPLAGRTATARPPDAGGRAPGATSGGSSRPRRGSLAGARRAGPAGDHRAEGVRAVGAPRGSWRAYIGAQVAAAVAPRRRSPCTCPSADRPVRAPCARSSRLRARAGACAGRPPASWSTRRRPEESVSRSCTRPRRRRSGRRRVFVMRHGDTGTVWPRADRPDRQPR